MENYGRLKIDSMNTVVVSSTLKFLHAIFFLKLILPILKSMIRME